MFKGVGYGWTLDPFHYDSRKNAYPNDSGKLFFVRARPKPEALNEFAIERLLTEYGTHESRIGHLGSLDPLQKCKEFRINNKKYSEKR